MKGATTDVDRYQAGIKNLQKLRADGSITQEQGLTILKQLNKDLDKAGFKKVAHNKFEKTQVKLLEEELELQKKINKEADLQKKIEAEKSKTQSRHLSDYRNRQRKSHSEIMDRALQMRRVNAKSHQLVMLNLRQQMNFMSSFSPGMAAGIAGNLAGAMGASGATIGAVRAATQMGLKLAVPVAGFVALGLAMKKAVTEADRLQRSTIDLGVLMGGGASNAQRLVKELQKLARTTPLATGQLVEGARQLMSFGRASSKVTEDLRILGTIAGGDTERMRLLTKAFGDVIAAGKLQGQELRQMTNQGFNPLREMVELTGKSYSELRLEMERGNVTSQMVFESMASAAEGYAGRLEASMDTVSGQLQRLKGLLEEMFATGGSGYVSPTAKGLELLGDLTEGTVFVLEKIQEGGLVVGRAAAETVEGLRRLFSGEDASEIFSVEGLRKFREEQARLSTEYQNRLIDEKLASEEGVRILAQGDPEKFKRMMEVQAEIEGAVAKEIVKREKLLRQELGVNEEEHKLRLLQRELAIAEEKSQGRKADELRKSIGFQRDLMKEQEALEKRKKAIKIAKDYIDEVYNHEEKRIADTLKSKTDAVNKDFKHQQEIAAAARAAGGPSGDFTAGGADYRFVQQRRAESEARRISDRANNTRERQLQELIDIAEEERAANREFRERELQQPQFSVEIP
jgi:tape measure domain-containing protein